MPEFIGAYTECCSISRACELTHIPRGTHYFWLATDPNYRDAWFDCKPMVAERLEDEAVRRGFEGVRRPVTIAGEREEIMEYDSGLLKMLLMAHAPERFKQRVEQTNFEKISLDDMTPEMMDKLADHLIAKALKEKGLNTPEMVEQVGKRLAAGEQVTIAQLERAQEPKE
jgi:hypothetical protein